MNDIQARGYAHPEMLVSTEWVAAHLNDSSVRIIESNEDVLLYRTGHVPGAVEIDWTRDLNDKVRRDYVQALQFSELLSHAGISEGQTIVFYGDKNNWWACYALWVFSLFHVPHLKIMDGGRRKWQLEGRPLTKEAPAYRPGAYDPPPRDDLAIRIFRDGVMAKLAHRSTMLVDVRSPEEFRGERLHMPDYPNEGALRGGHIPGAQNVPWSRAINTDDGTFKDADELRSIYEAEHGLSPSADVIVYCRIGERSSHTWFVLQYLLGYARVKNYDGSWTEWGNLVNAPIER